MKRLMLLAFLAAMTAGCTSIPSNYAEPQQDSQQIPRPQPGKALVIFLRPDFTGGAIPSAFFDITQPETRLIGIAARYEAIAYQADPGEHRFMVELGSHWDIGAARLDAGKTYYMVVNNINFYFGVACELDAIHADPTKDHNLQSKDFVAGRDSSHFVVMTDAARDWFTKHSQQIDADRKQHTTEWDTMSKANKDDRTLLPQDGID